MRPVEKGTVPRHYRKYGEAKDDLIGRIGDYCSYCERQIETHLAVEHVQPKSKEEKLRLAWSNFLLGCVNCNSCKKDKAVILHQYLWPDTDNTFRAFDYLEGGLVIAHSALSTELKQKAIATINLVGLDRDPGNPDKAKRPTKADKRWKRRQEAWELAKRERQRLQRKDTSELRETIVDVATGRGMFSIWMKVFEDDPDMRCRLIAGFKGTAQNCFDTDGKPIPRPKGQL